MSTPTTATPTDPHAPHQHAHPSDFLYFKVFVVLFVFTAVEVSTYYVDFGKAAIPVLLTLMTIKFGTVAAFFMHLRFDSNLFRRVFVAGIILAIAVYIIALATFEFWA